MGLQLRADRLVREVGHGLKGDAPLADIQQLLEFPHHVQGGRDARRGRRPGAQEPHQIARPQREAAGEII